MFASTIVPAVLAMAGAALALPAANGTMSVFESVVAPPSGWAKDANQAFVKSDEDIQLRIQVVHQNMDQFYEQAINVSQACRTCQVPTLFLPRFMTSCLYQPAC
jgi:hypothetical protein